MRWPRGSVRRALRRAERFLFRLDDACRELVASLAGALPVAVLAGVLIFGGVPERSGDPGAIEARCNPTAGDAAPPVLGPDPHTYRCHARALEAAANEAGRRSSAEGIGNRQEDGGRGPR